MESSVAEGVATGHLNPYTLKPYSLDDGFVYDDESDIPKPTQIKNRPPEKSLQEHKLPQDLSNSSKLLVSSANLARATKVVETSRKSHFFPTSSQSTPELSQPKLSSSPPDLLENVCPTATPEWFSGASSQPSVQFTDSQLSKFMYSSQSITDGFSYHQSSIRLATTISHQTFSKPAESNKYEEEKNSENLDGIQLFGSMAEYSDTEVVAGVLSQNFQSATCDKEFDASNASVVNDQSQNENAGPSLSQPSQNEENPKVQYMEWNHSTPPAHSSQTQRHVNKAVESAVNRLGLFRVNSNEKNLYSSVLKNLPLLLLGP
ncbi:hypothetical protein BCR33DRAFT_494763 [Rhizoclosmatium globosum]|uniref:Uncharacterized protein n=1 Tax=Rhizoclosmatium globosum TaxID=329046 RepID=A0A1Y2CVC3_9FUNG|nr:hypothetical protein BCR33DRAFT_494763 [Rhizoclosmatium globosum]|eukprot:ORY50764.1 hypothetical protein BCR33DRAFT_494763 [Rhizoclosmatium globosum]